MLTENKDVPKGIANRTQAIVEKVVLKRRESYGSTKLIGGNQREKKCCIVKSVLAHQIDYVQLRRKNENIRPAVFRMKPQYFTFMAEIPCTTDIHGIRKNSLNLGQLNYHSSVMMQQLVTPNYKDAAWKISFFMSGQRHVKIGYMLVCSAELEHFQVYSVEISYQQILNSIPSQGN